MPPSNAKAVSGSKPESKPEIKSGIIQMHGFLPRCWATIGQKIQVHNFEPVSVDLGYAEDVQPNETKEQVMGRVVKFLKTQIAPEIRQLENAKNSKNK